MKKCLVLYLAALAALGITATVPTQLLQQDSHWHGLILTQILGHKRLPSLHLEIKSIWSVPLNRNRTYLLTVHGKQAEPEKIHRPMNIGYYYSNNDPGLNDDTTTTRSLRPNRIQWRHSRDFR